MTMVNAKPKEIKVTQSRRSCLTRIRGFTLIEMMIVVAIVAVLAALAAPSFNDYFEKNRVKNAAEEVHGFLLQAKAEGPIRDANMSFSTNSAASPWCVGFSDSANCDCTNTTSCVINVAGTDVVQRITGDEFPGVVLSETFAGTGTTFNRLRNTANPGGTISLTANEWQLDIVVSQAGRIWVCNPNSNTIAGYPSC